MHTVDIDFSPNFIETAMVSKANTCIIDIHGNITMPMSSVSIGYEYFSIAVLGS